MIIKQCTKCKNDLPLSEFYADKRREHGVGSECRSCKRLYRQENKSKLFISQKQRRERNKEKLSPCAKVWNAAYYAIKTGKLIKSDACECCGSVEDVQGHHTDYDKPLDVVWTCQKCHVILNNQRRTA